MPDDSDKDAPLSPEEMMQRLFKPEPEELGPPEDFLPDEPAPDDPPPPPPPALDSRPRDAAAPFIALRDSATLLAQMLNNEEISFEDYQRQLYDGMLQADDGNWWMIDAENDEWYRHDSDAKEWLLDYPEALRAWEEAQAADARPDEPTETVYELPPAYREPDEPVAGAPIVDERGVEIGRVPPTKDELYTFPATAAFADELPDQHLTAPAVTQAAGLSSREAPVIPRATDPGDRYDAAPVVQDVIESHRIRSRRRWTIAIAVFAMLALVSLIIAGGGILMWYSNTVEPFQERISALADYTPAYQTARIFAADGSLIAALNSRETGARTTVPLEQISPYMIHAIVSQENERYFADPGFDPIAIARAFLQNLSGGGVESGASTITQQIARNLVLRDTAVNVGRKINEILVAMEIARQYDKNFVLELYLNEIFLANQNYGVEAAAQFYFGHGADELNFAEAALLASIVPSPALYDPVANHPNAIRGMRSTMGKMIDIGCLQFQHADWARRGPFCIVDGAETDIDGAPQTLLRLNEAGAIVGGAAIVQIAEIETTTFKPLTVRMRYPHFANFVQARLEAEFGANALFQRGLNIYTTLDPALQDAAEKALSEQVANLVANATGVNTGAVMVSDPSSGAILAWVGSHNFDDEVAGQVNNALTWQQPGSVIKPILYAAALQESDGDYLTPASIIWDVPTSYDMGAAGMYTPVNIDGEYRGAVSLRQALQNSLNVATVRLFDQLGKARFVDMVDAFGLVFPQESLIALSSALGSNEVTLFDMQQAYAVFANGGVQMPLYAIERVTETINGVEQEIPRERAAGRRVISPALAHLMQNILSDDAARQPGFNLASALTLENIGIATANTVAAKTGTSNGARDLWTMGFTRDAVVGVWIGTSDNSPTWNTSGIKSAAPVWNAVMRATAAQKTPQPFDNPGGVVAREICRATGTLNHAACPDPSSGLFLHNQYPPGADAGYIQRVAVDSWSGLRANAFCQSNVVERNFAAIDDANALAWLNDTAEGRAFAESVGFELPVKTPPQAACSQGQPLPQVTISSPNEGAVVHGVVEIRGQVRAPDFERFELQYASRDDPATFYPISASLVEMPGYGMTLGFWDTVAANVPAGDVILRLIARSNSGGVIIVERSFRLDNAAWGDDGSVFTPTIINLPDPTETP